MQKLSQKFQCNVDQQTAPPYEPNKKTNPIKIIKFNTVTRKASNIHKFKNSGR